MAGALGASSLVLHDVRMAKAHWYLLRRSTVYGTGSIAYQMSKAHCYLLRRSLLSMELVRLKAYIPSLILPVLRGVICSTAKAHWCTVLSKNSAPVQGRRTIY